MRLTRRKGKLVADGLVTMTEGDIRLARVAKGTALVVSLNGKGRLFLGAHTPRPRIGGELGQTVVTWREP